MREEQGGMSQRQTALTAGIPLISEQVINLLYKLQVGKPLRCNIYLRGDISMENKLRYLLISWWGEQRAFTQVQAKE